MFCSCLFLFRFILYVFTVSVPFQYLYINSIITVVLYEICIVIYIVIREMYISTGDDRNTVVISTVVLDVWLVWLIVHWYKEVILNRQLWGIPSYNVNNMQNTLTWNQESAETFPFLTNTDLMYLRKTKQYSMSVDFRPKVENYKHGKIVWVRDNTWSRQTWIFLTAHPTNESVWSEIPPACGIRDL